jgi:hypothetical protein
MVSQPQVLFLREKIMELGQALFFNDSDAVLKLPTSLINVLHVDEAGQVWFILRRPGQHINEFDKNLTARLEFYKKGKPFYLHITGKATIVADPEEINNISGISAEVKQQALDTMVLIKLVVFNIYYYSYPPVKQETKKEFRLNIPSSGIIKTLQDIVKDIIPVFQSHRYSD